MTVVPRGASEGLLHGWRVAFVGRLAGMPKREAQQLVRRQGAVIVDELDATLDAVIVGEAELPLPESLLEASLCDAMRQAVDRGSLQVLTETQLWQRLGLVEDEPNIQRLYTPAMLAELIRVPVSVIRRWHRRGLIVPAREVRKLPYFDFQEVATARRLAELLAAGMSPQTIEKKLAAFARFLPAVERPLAQLSIIIEGKHLLLRQGDGLIEPGGQLRFDFGALADDQNDSQPALRLSGDDLPVPDVSASVASLATPDEMLRFAGELEDAGHLDAAAEMYRASLAAGGPRAETCFLLAEVLYQLGELGAARERYYMAIEIDEDYVEARANLGCVLAETGQLELAVAAFQGALAYHGDYADVHYHLARTLDELRRGEEAATHWQAFLRLAPDSPWADEACRRLELAR